MYHKNAEHFFSTHHCASDSKKMPHTLFIEPANTSGRKQVGIVRKYINSSLKDSNDDPKGI